MEGDIHGVASSGADSLTSSRKGRDAVAAWLTSTGLAQHIDAFQDAQWDDLDAIKEITKEDLHEMGITATGTKRKILAQAARLRAAEGASPLARGHRSPSFDLSQPWHREVKIMNDGLHGHMHMPTYCVEFIDTPQFQRLRDLKQLGTSYYGIHTRPTATRSTFAQHVVVHRECSVSWSVAQPFRTLRGHQPSQRTISRAIRFASA